MSTYKVSGSHVQEPMQDICGKHFPLSQLTLYLVLSPVALFPRHWNNMSGNFVLNPSLEDAFTMLVEEMKHRANDLFKIRIKLCLSWTCRCFNVSGLLVELPRCTWNTWKGAEGTFPDSACFLPQPACQLLSYRLDRCASAPRGVKICAVGTLFIPVGKDDGSSSVSRNSTWTLLPAAMFHSILVLSSLPYISFFHVLTVWIWADEACLIEVRCQKKALKRPSPPP